MPAILHLSFPVPRINLRLWEIVTETGVASTHKMTRASILVSQRAVLVTQIPLSVTGRKRERKLCWWHRVREMCWCHRTLCLCHRELCWCHSDPFWCHRELCWCHRELCWCHRTMCWCHRELCWFHGKIEKSCFRDIEPCVGGTLSVIYNVFILPWYLFN